MAGAIRGLVIMAVVITTTVIMAAATNTAIGSAETTAGQTLLAMVPMRAAADLFGEKNFQTTIFA
jgi:hypothetical protein